MKRAMSDSARFQATADQMLKLATASVTEVERRSYIELARHWRKLAEDARDLEGKRAPQIDGVVVPMPESREEPGS